MALDFSKSKSRSLMNAVKSAETANSKIVRDIPLDKLVETEDNEHIFGIKQEDVDRLAEEIKESGFTGSISVEDLHDAEGRYQIISGHQRYRAVKELGWKTIPCIVSQDLTREEFYRKLLASNVVGRKLSPIAYARAIEAYQKEVLEKDPDQSGSKRTRISKFFNISEGQVQRYQAITRMPESIQALCGDTDTTFPWTVLVEAVTLTEEQKQVLADKIISYMDGLEEGQYISVNIIKQMINSIKDAEKRDEDEKMLDSVATASGNTGEGSGKPEYTGIAAPDNLSDTSTEEVEDIHKDEAEISVADETESSTDIDLTDSDFPEDSPVSNVGTETFINPPESSVENMQEDTVNKGSEYNGGKPAERLNAHDAVMDIHNELSTVLASSFNDADVESMRSLLFECKNMIDQIIGMLN